MIKETMGRARMGQTRMRTSTSRLDMLLLLVRIYSLR